MKITLLTWGLLASSVFANLTFSEMKKEVNAPADVDEITVEFSFTNKSEKPVQIVSADGKCSCISVAVEKGKLIYQPGESGLIQAKFNMSNYSGVVEKPIYVYVDQDPEDKPSIQLMAKVNIPELVKTDIKTVQWETGSKPEPKTIRVTVDGEDPVKVLNITTGATAFNYALKTVKEGREYEVVISPKSTENPAVGVFRLETDCKLARHKYKQVFASIHRPMSNPAAGEKK